MMASNIDLEAKFFPSLNSTGLNGVLYVAEPLDACQNLSNKPEHKSSNGTSPFVLIVRGGCSFAEKLRNAELAGFKAAFLCHDDVHRHSDILTPSKLMFSDENNSRIHVVFASKASGEILFTYAALGHNAIDHSVVISS